jgi:hypothetical protein
MSSPMDFLTECYYKESLETIKQVYSTLNKENVNMEELLEGFKNMYRPLNNIKVKETVAPKASKPRAPRVQKELTEEEKCIATKKDGTRCKGKKLPTGKNPELCSLHNNAISNSKVTIKPKEVIEITCDHVFTKGQNKDKTCVRAPLENDTKCKLHSESDLQVPGSSKKSSVSAKKLSEEYIEPEMMEEDLGLDYEDEVYD